MIRIPFGAHGYASFFLLSVFDRYYKPNLTRAEARQLIKMCLEELKKRFIVNLPNFVFKIVDATGTHDFSIDVPAY